MATTTHHQNRDARRRTARSVLLVAALLGLICIACAGSVGAVSTAAGENDELDGRDERQLPTNRPTVEAAFPRESYSPGDIARLVVWKMTLKELALRMRCSQCGKKAAEVVAVARPRPRGVPKNPH